MGQLLWIASYPKSGNTWVRAFLHNYIRAADRPQDINDLTALTTGESAAARYQPHDPRPATAYGIADVQRLRPIVHREMAAARPGITFVKTHSALLVVEGVQTITKEVTAGCIYVLRDPRDVAVSFSRHLGLSLDRTIAFMADPEAATGGTETSVYVPLATWSAHVHFWTRRPSPQLQVLCYEDMLADPAAVFGGLVRFLGEEPAPDRLARAVAFSDFAILRAQEAAHGFVEQPAQSVDAFFRVGQAGQWRQVLSPAQSGRIERDHGAVMQRFGYL